MPLSKKKIMHSVGSWIPNHRGEIIGKLEGLTLDPAQNIPAYLILRHDEFVRQINHRYYLISAHPALVAAHGDTILLRIDKAVLSIVMGVSIEKIPPFNPKIASIFELYGIDEAMLNYSKSKSKQ